MTIIFYEEICRAGSGGLLGAGWIHYVAVGPILLFGTPKLRQMIEPVMRAEKFASLCISEPTAGSDVRNITCKAVRQGDHYIVTGEKYWITGGLKSDYFITAVRTGGPGINGITLLLIPRGPGVITTRLPLQGHDTSATAYVVFNKCKVPVENIIGKENEGFKPIMFNFNSERFGIIVTAVGLARCCIEEAARYAQTRHTFGKPLIKHQVIRHKIADMSRQCICSQLMLEKCAFLLSKDKYGQKDKSIAKNIALLKVQASKSLQYITIESSQIFGGRSFVRGGRGAPIDEAYRSARACAIAAGSEEIMYDLAMRQAKL